MAEQTVFITRKIRNGFRRQLEGVARVLQWDDDRPVPRAVLLDGVREADALLCMGDDFIDREVIMAGKRLRVISVASAGYDHLDLDAAVERGIIVCHAPATTADTVADMALALLLACARRVVDADRFVREGAWEFWYPYLLQGVDVHGSTLAIIGLGRIGLQVAHRALGFGMRVLYHDPRRNPDAEQRLGLQYGSLDNVLREADFVTLHVPLTAATRGLLNEERMRLMKPTAYLINLASGALVEADILVRALREGWIAGAGLDVFTQEPLPAGDPLLTLPNVILAPHIAANTRRGVTRTLRLATEQIIQVLQGKAPKCPVFAPPGQQAA